jgi:outer membrane receptor protein involved in Fe transport
MLLKRNYLFGTTILAGVIAASAAAPAFAQTRVPDVDVAGNKATTVEEVVVTGSRIRRDAANSATPLITVSREALLDTGQNTVIDYLATIPALSNSRVPSDTVDVFAQGVGFLGISSPNLRSLGAGRTLTLVDGKRHIGSVGGSLQVDVDTIPRLLIENIEIVTGGASSVYGADAVSGVLNFVLRKDFEGLEVDLNAAQINQGGKNNSYRASVLAGKNLLDDRLNLWAFAEYEHIDAIDSLDLNWLRNSYALVAIDADPTSAPFDGDLDAALFSNLKTLSRPLWGQTTLANTQAPSPLNNPLIPTGVCNTTSATGYLSANCYAVNPGKTFIYEGTTARLANFGQRIGTTGLSRTFNIGGDGYNPNGATFEQRTPEQDAQRYSVGANYAITDNLNLSLEAKYIDEDAFANSQPVFFDVFLSSRAGAGSGLTGARWLVNTTAYNQFELNYLENPYLPQNVKDAITANTLVNYNSPTTNAAGTPIGVAGAAQIARHSLFGPQRGQDQNRQLQRYVASLDGSFDSMLFVKNISWEASYVYGDVENRSIEDSVDVERFVLASDAVVDAAGRLGTPGAIVCRSRLTLAAGNARVNPADPTSAYVNALPEYFRAGNDLRDSAAGLAAVNQCQPLNIFGDGNQSDAARNYVRNGSLQAVVEENSQEQAVAYVSGELWDFFGAGRIGLALGGEYRKETTSAAGRDDQNDLFLFGLQGPDFPEASYESNEYFAELSIPLMKDTFLGEYAEISGSYRTFDYSTAGTGDVYGVNFVYRPIHDIGFKASYNTSFRAPNLGENFSPLSQTFSNGFTDPCTTANITAGTLAADIKANRIANCTALAVAKGYTAGFFDFAGATATTDDDFVQSTTSVSGVSGGNPALLPETSESKTFTVVLAPRFIPNFNLVLDYYEIRIDNIISAVAAPTAAAICVNGTSLAAACSSIFRNTTIIAPAPGQTNVERSAGFQIGGRNAQDPGFIEGSVNFAGAQTRGLDFTANYSFDTAEMLGHDFGQFRYSLRGNWLIEQKQFNDPIVPTAYTEFASNPQSPRVRLSSTLSWQPIEPLRVSWTMDWQTAQDILRSRDLIAANNLDNRAVEYWDSGNFARNDFSVSYKVRDDLTLRATLTNAFDAEQPQYLGGTLYDNYDPYGRRLSIGLNFRPW